MREAVNLEAQPRSGQGKGAAYRLRLTGNIPAVVYGGKGKPEA